MDNEKESVFLSDNMMTTACIIAVCASLMTIFLVRTVDDKFIMFEDILKLVTICCTYVAYKRFSWDVTKGLMGGVLFCLMYQEAHLVLEQLWGKEDFDTYLIIGVQGSIYLAAAGMSFIMTIIITINHFIINYAKKGNPENVILNRMAIVYKIVVTIVMIIANSKLTFAKTILWENGLRYITDIAIILLIISIESKMDSFKVLREELLKQKKERRKSK